MLKEEEVGDILGEKNRGVRGQANLISGRRPRLETAGDSRGARARALVRNKLYKSNASIAVLDNTGRLLGAG